MATTKNTKTSVYEIITTRVCELLESGVIPWHKPWNAAESTPRNLVSKKAYRGINSILLNSLGFSSPWFLTFAQAQAKGGKVRKGERGFPVVFWKIVETKDEETGEKKNIPLLRYSTVFNLAQIDGIAAPAAEAAPALGFDPIEEAQQILAGMPQAPAIHHGHNRAFYRPATDEIGMPDPEAFLSAEEYYSTLFHELTHSTGHASRCDRKGVSGVVSFGSESYAQEELVAEMGAAFLCAEAGLTPAVIENQAAYIQGWLSRLRKDPKCLIQAASQAQKAADFILVCGQVQANEE